MFLAFLRIFRGFGVADEDTEEDADDLDETPEVDVGDECYAAEVQVDDDSIAIADELEEDDDERPALGSVESVVEEDANAAELDDVGEDEMHEVDVGEENNEIEVFQVQDDIIANSDEVAEAEDEGPEAESAEGAAVEEESNSAELDEVGDDTPATDEDTEEDADDVELYDTTSVSNPNRSMETHKSSLVCIAPRTCVHRAEE